MFLLKKIFFFLSPLLLFFLFFSFLEFLLPIDYFNFRVWEAAVVKTLPRVTIGPFYPNLKIDKTEVGELAAHTNFALEKKVHWDTDKYGYRYSGDADEKFDVVVIGDSNITGSALTQTEMYTEFLQGLLDKKTYPLAPAFLNTFLHDYRFRSSPPKVVIFSAIERTIPDLAPIDIDSNKIKFKLAFEKILSYKEHSNILVVFDRITKFSFVNKIRSLLNLRYGFPLGKNYNGTLYLPESHSTHPEGGDVDISVLSAYNDAISQKDILFIFLPIPNKETIYYKELGVERPLYLEKLIKKLKEKNINVIDTLSAFQSKHKEGEDDLYFKDDSHWSFLGVRTAAEATADYINNLTVKPF